MTFYISFGQSHAHTVNGITFDKDCLAEVEAEDYNSAYNKAHEVFGPKFCTVYEEPKMEFYPRGAIKLKLG